MYIDNKILCLCKNMNTFIVKYVKKIEKNKIIKKMKKINNNQIIQSLINEIFKWFTEDCCKSNDFILDKTNKTNKNKKRCNKYNELIHKLHKTKNEKKILQYKVNDLVDEIKQLTDKLILLSNKNEKLETENEELNRKNEELKEQLKNRSFKSKKTFKLIPYY